MFSGLFTLAHNMSYRIDVQKNFQTEIKRIITEQLSGVTSKINDPEVEFDEKVHASRKHFKKIRAVWRLIRDDIGKKMYQSENVFYRDLGRKLAVMPEVRVHLKTLKDMEEDHADEDSFNQIQAYLQKRYASEKERVKQEHILDQITEQVELGKQRVIDLQLSNEIFNAFEKGIKRVYKKGTKALEAAKKDTSTENLHEWRKRVKYLWYHVRLLQNVWKPVLKGYENSLDILSDYLGDEHDLSELKKLINNNVKGEYPEETKHLTKILDKQRNKLQQKAWSVGERIYTKPTKLFINKLDVYMDSHEHDL